MTVLSEKNVWVVKQLFPSSSLNVTWYRHGGETGLVITIFSSFFNLIIFHYHPNDLQVGWLVLAVCLALVSVGLRGIFSLLTLFSLLLSGILPAKAEVMSRSSFLQSSTTAILKLFSVLLVALLMLFHPQISTDPLCSRIRRLVSKDLKLQLDSQVCFLRIQKRSFLNCCNPLSHLFLFEQYSIVI